MTRTSSNGTRPPRKSKSLVAWTHSAQKEGRRGEQHPTPTSDLQVRISYSLLTINCAWPNKHTHTHTNTHITSQSLAGESAAV